jgi:vitellogenic carboxypeptidase-like protein
MGNISIFNFRNYDGMDESFATFLTNNRKNLGISETLEYIPGNDNVYTAFGHDVTKSYASDVATILSRVKTLIYNGQNDVVVNTPGVLQYLNSLKWLGEYDWKRKTKEVWKIDGKVTGWTKIAHNLWFVLVNGAGHMVPSDQPIPSYVMLGHFINNRHNWDL